MIGKRTLVLVVVTWLVGGSIASAESGLVVVRGNAAERERTAVATAIEAATRSAGWLLPTVPLAKRDADALLACADSKTPWTCVPASLRELHRLFVVGVDNRQSASGAPMAVITGKMIVPHTQEVIVRQRFCERCADDKLGETSTDLAVQILRELDVRSGGTVADIKSNPTGAEIILDGARIGATDAKLNVYPGKHMVILEKPGYVRETREFEVAAGKTAELVVELRPSSAAQPLVVRPSRRAPVLMIGTGLALFVAGGVLVATDQDSSLTGSQPKTFDNSAPYGVGYAIAGAAVTAVGVYWYVRRSKARSAPIATLLPAGGVVGWLGTF